MEDIYQKILEVTEEGRPSVLATLIRLEGSAPRGVGTRCLILEDGTFEGTIGGGLLEARVLEEARRVFETGRPYRLPFVMKGTDVADSGMICGGDAEVFLEPLLPEDAGTTLSVFRKALEAREGGETGVLATVVDCDRWGRPDPFRVFLGTRGGRLGTFPEEEDLADQCAKKIPTLFRYRRAEVMTFPDSTGSPVDVFLEPVFLEPFLFVFGGGHVSQQLVPLAARVGFKVVVVDDRPEFTGSSLFPDAVQVHCLPFDGVLEKLDVGPNAYLVIVTRGHRHDKTVLQQCLGTGASYIGMIGSVRKNAVIFEKLLEEGAGEDDLKRVHAPIGLAIGAETPEEIAVSIVAELIRVRAGLEE